MSGNYSDEEFRQVLDALHRLLVDPTGVRDSIDWNEPIRDEIDTRLRDIDRAREELEALSRTRPRSSSDPGGGRLRWR